jgi:hypothetical protein
MSRGVADLLVGTLQAARVKACYGAVGDTLNRITRAIAQDGIAAALMGKGFSLFMVEAVSSGRGTEHIDLARAYLWGERLEKPT